MSDNPLEQIGVRITLRDALAAAFGAILASSSRPSTAKAVVAALAAQVPKRTCFPGAPCSACAADPDHEVRP